MATVKGGFWHEYVGGTFTLSSGKSPLRRRIARLFGRNSLRALNEVAETLNGAAAGGTAAASHKQVTARENTNGELGGKRTIETITDVNRATTSDDITDLNAGIFNYPLQPTTYAANKDGNPRNYPGG